MKRESLENRIKKLSNKYGFDCDYALELLPVVKQAIGGKGKIYARVEKVSKSGMSSTIKLSIIHKGAIINLNNTVYSKIYGDSKKQGVVRINGYGMDMLFEATYRLYEFLFDQKKKPYQKHLVRYSGY